MVKSLRTYSSTHPLLFFPTLFYPSTLTQAAFNPPTMKQKDKSPYAPLDWKDFFDTKRMVPIPTDLDPSQLTFCVYETNRDRTDVPLIVLHHGAGFCARSFATTARELKKLLGDQARFLCYDVRGHGTVKSLDLYFLQPFCLFTHQQRHSYFFLTPSVPW